MQQRSRLAGERGVCRSSTVESFCCTEAEPPHLLLWLCMHLKATPASHEAGSKAYCSTVPTTRPVFPAVLQSLCLGRRLMIQGSKRRAMLPTPPCRVEDIYRNNKETLDLHWGRLVDHDGRLELQARPKASRQIT